MAGRRLFTCGLVTLALLGVSAPVGNAAPSERYNVIVKPGESGGPPKLAWVANTVAGFVIGHAAPAGNMPNHGTGNVMYVQRFSGAVQDFDTTRRYAYGQITGGDFGQWSTGTVRCGWIPEDYLQATGEIVSSGDVCPEPSQAPPPGGGLDHQRLFAPGTYQAGCGESCAGPAVITTTCSDLTTYANYDPATQTFRNPYGQETRGRGTAGYPGATGNPVTQPVSGFGSRYKTADGRAVLIKDTQLPPAGGANGEPSWRFMKADCVAGRQLGSADYVPPPPGWSQWEDLGGGLVGYGEPDALSLGNNHLDVYVTGSGGALYHKWFGTSGWSGWENLGGVLYGGPGVASWGGNRIDVFAQGAGNGLYHRWWDNGTWYPWEYLGCCLVGDPDVVSWGPGHYDVYIRGTDNRLYHKWFGSGGWSGWEDLGGGLTSSPTAVSWAPGRTDVFAVGSGNNLHHRWYQGGWSGWENLGGSLTSSPDAESLASGHIDVYSRDAQMRLTHKWFGASGWSAWQSLDGYLTTGPTVASMRSNRLDVFTRSQSGTLAHKWWDG